MTYASETRAIAHPRPFPKTAWAGQLHFLAFLCDLAALVGAFQVSQALWRHAPALSGAQPPGETRLVIYSCLSLAVLCFLALRGHYSSRVPWWSQVQHAGRIIFLALLADGFTSFAFGLDNSAVPVVAHWGAAFALVVTARLGVDFIKSRSAAWRVPVAVMAGADTAIDTLYALESDRGTGLSPRTLLLHDGQEGRLDREELPESCKNIAVLSGADRHEDFIRSHPEMFYIVSLDGLDGARRGRLVGLFQENNAAFALVPAISGTGIYQAEPHYFFGNDIMLLNARKPAALPGRVLKRAFDIAGGAAGLFVFFLPMLAIVALLKLEGQKGWPFYGGKRVGRGGRLFRCWKFETMGPDTPETDKILEDYLAANPEAKAHWDRYFKLPDDPRIRGRTARFIRKASIDELPQLWNVLKGDMSLVGPRPILPREADAYGSRYGEYIRARPGITGLWQVSGRNETSFQRRVIWDSWYVRNWTLWGDVVILVKTLRAVFGRAGAS